MQLKSVASLLAVLRRPRRRLRRRGLVRRRRQRRPPRRSRLSCADLGRLTFEGNTTVTTATTVSGGALTTPAGQSIGPLPEFCRVVGVEQADRRFPHQLRGVAAGQRLERQVSVVGRRRLRRRVELHARRAGRRSRRTAAARLRHRVDRYGPSQHRRVLGDRPSRARRRLRLPVEASGHRGGQGPDHRVLRQAARSLVLQLLLERRPAGPDRAAALCRGLRRRGGRRAVGLPVALERGDCLVGAGPGGARGVDSGEPSCRRYRRRHSPAATRSTGSPTG